MELNLGLKITRTRDDVSSSTDFQFSKDPFGPLFYSQETDTMFILIIHLKGFKKEGIEIEINKEGNRIKISGRKPVQEMVLIKWMPWKTEVELRAFTKVFRIPEIVNLDKVRAKFNNADWNLTITMPKKVEGITGLKIEEEKEEESMELEEVKEPEKKEEMIEEIGENEDVEEEMIERQEPKESPEKVEQEIVEEAIEEVTGDRETETQEETKEVIELKEKGTQVPEEESEKASSNGVEQAKEDIEQEPPKEEPPEEEPENVDEKAGEQEEIEEEEEEEKEEVDAKAGTEEELEKVEEPPREEERKEAIVEPETKIEDDDPRLNQEIQERKPEEPEQNEIQGELVGGETTQHKGDKENEGGEKKHAKVTGQRDSSEDTDNSKRKKKTKFNISWITGSALLMSIIVIVIHLIESNRKSK